ncbi:peptidoglycan-binding protein [Aliiruegeria lutimaris]|uniref:Putative peptidoglycan binding domain-containing protein n=1 Tax=Aliiruegeria lutimaris TaxID=571298 RepID=A0A1G8RNZ0_9RHOB|nr:peptidoglycan-binding protein [Aliiruegeria lutimaris]SDJ18701.1 Putative peptidoglycan binding domain-containing protein [Aliiruegeria lutimaris]
MLTSNRFTTVVTRATADRLAKAQANNPPIAKRERDRGAVVAVQTALASLNNGYMAGSEIDGYFGSRTAAAVEAFQRDYGLVADGTVGGQVLGQLDQIFAGEAARPPHGVSLHIGVDRVDPGHYGSDLALPSCVNDAREMEGIAEQLGYDTARLENDDATCANVIGFLRNAAVNLFAGDALFFTYSGHGSQVPNDSADDEPDLQDETLVLYDRMLIDDEIYAALGEFREGVRVHMVFDSCHSATAFKQIAAPDAMDMTDVIRTEFKKDAIATVKGLPTLTLRNDLDPEMKKPIAAKSLVKALDGDAPEFDKTAEPSDDEADGIGELFADLAVKTLTGAPKFVTGAQIYDNKKEVYNAVRTAVGSKELIRPACTVTALSAAMDNQTTPAGNPLSLFTFNISRSWDSGAFPGSYTEFHRSVVGRSRADATPQLTPDGSMGSQARLHERPFAF